MSETNRTLAIVVGGGPAPGINGIINAITIEAIKNGFRVFGIYDGFKWLAKGSCKYKELKIEDVSRIFLRGGSILGTSRENPTENPAKMENVVKQLQSLGVTHLATIGGDDTAYTSSQIEEKANQTIHVVHVPKTIDNDLPLPGGVPTFGFETARHYGVQIIQNIMEDALTTKRWYLCVTMGRKAGFLALGIGKAAGTHLILIPEEFSENTPLETLCDVIEGTLLKRQVEEKPYGVIVMGEGIIEKIDKNDLKDIKDAPRDPHGHIRYAEIDIAKEVSSRLQKRFESRKDKTTLVCKNIGYELRCAPPIPFDCEYTRDLGYCAMKYLVEGNSGSMISIFEGNVEPIPFHKMKDPITKKTRIRLVDTSTTAYRIAREYQIRIEEKDLEGEKLERLAAAAGMAPQQFAEKYRSIVKA